MYCDYSSPTLNNCTLIGNSATYGGALLCSHSSPTVTNCTLTANSAGDGGALCCWDSSSPTLTNCALSGNSASDDGGAVFCWDSPSPTLTNCTLSGNSAGGDGGALYCYVTSPTLTNCTLSRNSAGGDGGALHCWISSSPTLTNCTLSGNSATYAARSTASLPRGPANELLFHGNSGGDWSDGSHTYTGAAAINASIPHASDNVDGDPLFQMDSAYGIGGTWTAAASYNATTDRTTLTDSGASLVAGALVGRVINCDTTQSMQALITTNTATTVEVVGDVTGYAESGDTYVVVDYHLMSGSAAINTGTATGAPSDDFDGDLRPIDSFFDIGFDEFLDTDGDGLSDWFEIGYDGDWSSYDPYDPSTNPTGTDLNYDDADTDGDGLDDGDEVNGGSDPTDPDDPTPRLSVDGYGAERRRVLGPGFDV